MRSTGTHRHICLPCSTAPIHSALHHRTPALQSLKRIRKFKHTTTASGPKTADENFSFRPRKRSDWQIGPSFELSGEQAVLTQLEVSDTWQASPVEADGDALVTKGSALQALQRNNDPSPDHGIEVLYRFANFDPFTRSNYFG